MSEANHETVHFGGTDVGAIVERLRSALAQSPLVLSAEGGGIIDRQTLRVDLALLVDRRDIESLIGVLKAHHLVPR